AEPNCSRNASVIRGSTRAEANKPGMSPAIATAMSSDASSSSDPAADDANFAAPTTRFGCGCSDQDLAVGGGTTSVSRGKKAVMISTRKEKTKKNSVVISSPLSKLPAVSSA